MSSLIIEVCKIDDIYPHPNAESLEIIKIKGWEVCAVKGNFTKNSKCIYFPPDSVLPTSLSDKLGITKYLSNGRVKAVNLRGFNSYGTVTLCDQDLAIGTDMAEELGITKYEQPIKCIDGDSERPNPAFHTYFSMENLKNYPYAFSNNEDVIFTEKIHGQNARVGLIKARNDNGQCIWEFMCGSHDVRRKQYLIKSDGTKVESVFWKALTPNIKNLLIYLTNCTYNSEEIENGEAYVQAHECGLDESKDVVLFSERFGSSVQDLTYSFTNGNFDFRYFDISINGRYISCEEKYKIFNKFNVKTVPILYSGSFNFDKAIEFASGKSTLASNLKEGIVIVSAIEQSYNSNKKFMTRKQFKLINPDYLTRKGNTTEYH